MFAGVIRSSVNTAIGRERSDSHQCLARSAVNDNRVSGCRRISPAPQCGLVFHRLRETHGCTRRPPADGPSVCCSLSCTKQLLLGDRVAMAARSGSSAADRLRRCANTEVCAGSPCTPTNPCRVVRPVLWTSVHWRAANIPGNRFRLGARVSGNRKRLPSKKSSRMCRPAIKRTSSTSNSAGYASVAAWHQALPW